MVQKVKDAFLMERELQKTFGIECCDSIDGFKDFVFLNRFGKVHNNGTLNKALRRIVRDCNLSIMDKNKSNSNDILLAPHLSNHIFRHTFTTILKNLNYDTQNVTQNVTQSEGQNDGQKLKPSDRREKILEIIRNNPKITAYDLSKQFNVTDRTIKRDLKVLTDEKTIEYIGSAKDGYWKVNK